MSFKCTNSYLVLISTHLGWSVLPVLMGYVHGVADYFRGTRGTGWDRLAHLRRNLFWGLPEERHGKRFPFVCREMGMGREDGKRFG